MDEVKREALSQRVRKVKSSGIRKFAQLATSASKLISLDVGEPDFTTPEHICQAAINALSRRETGYTSNYGKLELRREIAARLSRRYSLHYNPLKEILVTVGVSEGVDLAIRTLVDPGDEVIALDPGYVAYAACISLADGIIVPVPTYAKHDFCVRAASIEAAITPKTKVILLGNPHNPTGAVIARTELEEIALIAQQHDLYVIADEIYSSLIYDTQHTCLAALPNMRERTILLDGFSKAYAMAGWRIGYVAAPAYILEAMMKIHQHAIICASSIAQEAALEALRYGEQDISIMHEAYAARRRLFVDGLNQIGFTCCEPHGTFYAFPSISQTGMSDEQFAEKLLFEELVSVVPGSAFGAAGTGYVRCAYCTSLERLEEALIRMERFLRKHSK